MGIILFFGICIIGLLILTRLEAYRLISEEGGIRTKYNKIFSFFYNLPNSTIGIETKSYVTFKLNDHRSTKMIKMNYYMDTLTITCKVTYFDDTPFDNNKKFKWDISNNYSEELTINEIIKTFAALP